MTTIERLQALKRSLEAAIKQARTYEQTDFVRGMIAGYINSIYAADLEIKMIEAGEGEKA